MHGCMRVFKKEDLYHQFEVFISYGIHLTAVMILYLEYPLQFSHYWVFSIPPSKIPPVFTLFIYLITTISHIFAASFTLILARLTSKIPQTRM